MNIKNPLLDKQFLQELDYNHNKVTYIRITSLTFDNYPVEQIEGVVTEGSINLDGASSVRRTCSLTLTTNNLNINNIYWSLTTRIKIEIGIENNLLDYNYYPNIIWFSQGIFILTDFQPSAQINNYTIKITAKDKMCLLNGDIGGIFNAETQLDSERVYDDNGTYKDEKRSLEYIIKELVHNYALEDYHNIIIKGLDELQKRILQNNSSNIFYLIKNYETGEIIDIASNGSLNSRFQYCYKNQPDLLVNFKIFKNNFIFDQDDLNTIYFDDELQKHPTFIIMKENSNIEQSKENINYVVIKLDSGADIGYELTELLYPTELIAGVGETVTSVLDKIIKTFGIYEYFYNINGQFVFQPKAIYVNNMWNNTYYLDNEQYIPPDELNSKVDYKFEGSQIITTYTSNPQIGKIKNDFTVWGKKPLSSGDTIPIHIRYAIDVKPLFYTTFLKDNNVSENYMSKDFYDIIKREYKYINQDTKEIKTDNGMNIEWVLVQKNNTSINKKILSLYEENSLISDFFIDINDKLYFLSQIKAEEESVEQYQATLSDKKSSNELKIQTISQINKLLNYYYDFYEITDWRELIYQMAKDYQKYSHNDNYNMLLQQNNNKQFLRKDNILMYMRPYEKGKTGYEQYYTDLLGFWRTLYLPEKELKGIETNILKNKSFININDFYIIQHSDNFILEKKFIGPWNQNIINAPSNLIFWFDFFDANSINLGQFSVPAIGDRPKNEVNDDVQALIYNNIPDIVYIEANDYQDFLNKGWILSSNQKNNNNLLVNGYNYIINSDIFSQYLGDGRISVSSKGLSGYEVINDLLYNNAYSNEQININCIPIYYLEPNSIISVLDQERGINGLYIINTISLPLSYSGTMTINAIKVPANLE